MNDKIMQPWTPVVAVEEGASVSVDVWNRRYLSDEKSFLSSIKSGADELLYAPVRIVLREDGQENVFKEYKNFLMTQESEAYVNVVSEAKSEQFLVNLCMCTEFDGFIDVKLTVAPRGRSIKQCFGLEDLKQYNYELDRLWLEIPLSAECAKYYQFYPRAANTDPLSAANKITEKIELPFKEQVFVTNERAGIITSFESEGGFTPCGRENTFELIPDENGVVLRVRLIDAEPELWHDSALKRIDLTPITYHFAFMATPVKPMSDCIFTERAVHIDCYEKITEEYEDYLSSPFENGDEITFDRLKRLGVNTLYLHERWNDLQNSPVLTAKTARRLSYIVEQAHKRGIRVIPYFGYEMSILAPYYSEMKENVQRITELGVSAGWYREPQQRNIRVCQKSRWSKFFVDGIERLMDQYHFDGIYLDGTAYVWPCMNASHGCGFTDSEGNVHTTYPVFAVRDNMKRLYDVVVNKRGGIINCHAGSAFNMPALSFASSIWDGETFQGGFLKGTIDKLPDDYFKCLYTGLNIGVPIFMLCYLNPPLWDFDMALSITLPFGIIPKVNDAGKPLETISEIWKLYDSFGVREAEFIPYYKNCEKDVLCSDSDVKISLYKKDGRALAVIATTDKNYSSDVTVESKFGNAKNAITGELLSKNGNFTVHLEGFDFILVLFE